MGQNRPRRSFGRALARSLAALALAIQCFVIQPHIDGVARAAPAAETTASRIDQHGPLVCVICEAAATARTGITPAPAAITLVEATLYVGATPPSLPVLESRPSLPWQSRAPPLQA
jgi:hypothetical protein